MPDKKLLLNVGAPPHIRTGNSVAIINYATILAIIPAILWAAFSQGEFAMTAKLIGFVAFGAGCGVLIEYLVQLVLRQPYHATDGHGAFMGILLALILPITAPWWVLFIAVLMGILIGKQIYGGIGSYPFHPAMVGYLIVLLSWPHYVHPVGSNTIAAINPTVIYLTILGILPLLILGNPKWRVSIGAIVGVILGALLFGLAKPEFADPVAQLFSGHVMLAAFFIATDSTTSPANSKPQWAYGLGVGILIMLVRVFGSWPDAVPFAILLMNTLNPLLDRIRPRPREFVKA